MSARSSFRRLQRDFRDARNAFAGPLLPQIPYAERTWLRLQAEAAYRSEPAQRAKAALADAIARGRGRHDPDIPPRRLQAWVGDGDYRAVGSEFHRYFVDLGGLKPDHDVLDVGSGSGRMAFPLRDWLTGRYEGFDVAPEAVEWCRRRITPAYPNFRFQVADIRSERYNPTGVAEAEEYRFPYADASFDFAFLTSVFTHLGEPAVANYLSELARVLRPGGFCFTTYFLVNDEAVALMGGHGQFGVDLGGQMLVDERVPERTVAFREELVREMHDAAGLPITAIHPGSWCGRDRHTSMQDIVVSVRR